LDKENYIDVTVVVHINPYPANVEYRVSS